MKTRIIIVIAAILLLATGSPASATSPSPSHLEPPLPPGAKLIKTWKVDYTQAPFQAPRSYSRCVFDPTPITGGYKCYDLKNINDDGVNSIFITSNRSDGPGKLILSTKYTWANGVTAKFGLSNDFFTAEFGFSVTASNELTFTREIEVPRGKCYELRLYQRYQDWKGSLYQTFPSYEYKTWIRSWDWVGATFKFYDLGPASNC